jgi:hypothetical protein
LKRPETQTYREEFLRNKWPHISEEIALRKNVTGSKANELRNLGALDYKVRCKREDRAKKLVLSLGEGKK